MGLTNATSLTAPTAFKNGQNRFGLFMQDTWKVTRKLTLDYGLRWDYGTYSQEEYGRGNAFSTTAINQNAANHPGGSIFEATCNCKFVSNYPYQIGPRVGIAYQIDRKTVFRGGAGVVYQSAGFVGGAAADTLSSPPGPNTGDPSTRLSGCIAGLNCGAQLNGVTNLHPFWPDFSAGAGFTPGTIQSFGSPTLIDPNAMRSPRVYQFSAGLQREIHRNLVVEASYVGNRSIWLPAAGFGFGGPEYDSLNILTQSLLNQFQFQVPVNGNVTAADIASRTLLQQSLGTETPAQQSALALQGVGQVPGTTCTAKSCPSLPYAGYPTSGKVNAVFLPFPQYGVINPTGSPLGKSWYDGLQIVATQRLTHGLSMNANYTFSKGLVETSSIDPLNPIIGKTLSPSDLPHQFRFSADYVVPRIHSGNKILGNKTLSYVLGDWGIGWYGQYQSAPALTVPGNVAGGPNAVNNASSTGAIFCPYTDANNLGCNDPISDWLGYGPGPAQLRPGNDPATNQPWSPWSESWTDLNGVHHTDLININCHCYNPTTTNVLNPDAWISNPAGSFAANQQTVIRSFRGIRLPQENANVSRIFRIKERMTLQIRVEFQNIFNRLQLNAPGGAVVTSGGGVGFTTKPNITNGLFTGGFGTFGNIQANGTGNPRTGTFVARLQF
jgi:hypothetical protein